MSTPFKKKPNPKNEQRPTTTFLLNLRQVGTLLVAFSLIVQSLGLFSFVPSFSLSLVAQAATLAQAPTPTPSSSQDKSNTNPSSNTALFGNESPQATKASSQQSSQNRLPTKQEALNYITARYSKVDKAHPRVVVPSPLPVPSFYKILYSNDYTDDVDSGAGVDVCSQSNNTTCTLRDAIRLAGSDIITRGTQPDLIAMQPKAQGAIYVISSTVTVPSYVYFSNALNTDLSCNPDNGIVIFANSAGTPVTYDGFDLSDHDYVNGINFLFFNNAIAITGNSNVLTCQTLGYGNINGLLLGSGATNNQIGGLYGTDANLGSAAIKGGPNDVYFIRNNVGIVISGSNVTGNHIANAAVGFQYSATPDNAEGNLQDGILVEDGANGNYIGSPLITETNVINDTNVGTDGTGGGIVITGTNTSGNYVYNNQIGYNSQADNDPGTNPPFRNHLSNGDGIFIGGGASGNYIGGPNASQGNYIAFNAYSGIAVVGASDDNIIENNSIGLSLTLTSELPNGTGCTNPFQYNCEGISLIPDATNAGPSGTTIMSNTVSNGGSIIQADILVVGSTISNTISNNYLSTDVQGDNLSSRIGVALGFGASNNYVFANTIADNTAAGVYIGNNSSDITTTRNTISQNSMYSNTLGINLNYTNTVGIYNGVDAAPNNAAQVPTITTATYAPASGVTAIGTANANSKVELFVADSGVITNAEGKIYLGSGMADASGNFTVTASSASSVITNSTPILVATSTLNDSAFPNRIGSTSQFSAPFTATVAGVLTATPPSLTFSTTVGSNPSPASQTISLTAQNASINYSSTISYSGGASNWLTISPTTGTVMTTTATSVSATVSSTALAAGTYTATVTFADTNAANPNDKVTVPVTLLVNSLPITVSSVYTYNLPFLANNYAQNGITGTFTTYLAFQNAGTVTATVYATFYDASGNPISSTVLSSSPSCSPVPVNGECVLGSNPFANGTRGSGVITSTQPLNVIVPEGTPYGGSAYAITQGSSNSLVAPFAINNAFGDFVTQLNILNSGSVTVTANVTFYGTLIGSTTLTSTSTNVNIAPHTTANLNQNTLPNGFSGWAQITSTNSTLVAQVLEQSPSNKFVAIANAVFTPTTTLYASAIFNNGYGGFYTGANIINPNNAPVTVTVTYYNKDTNQATPTAPFQIQAHGVASIYQGSTSGGNGLPSGGLPNGFVGAATVTSSGGGVVMSVNENGGLTSTGNDRSGVYAATPSGGSVVGLPVISNGGYTYITGYTIFNTASQPVTATVNYYTPDGKIVSGASQTFTVTANGSYGVYQGASSLPGGFYGTAVITESNNSPANALIVTTNAQNPALFYTYSEPNP